MATNRKTNSSRYFLVRNQERYTNVLKTTFAGTVAGRDKGYYSRGFLQLLFYLRLRKEKDVTSIR